MTSTIKTLSTLALACGLSAAALAAPPTLSPDKRVTFGDPIAPVQMQLPVRKLASMVDIYSSFNADPNNAYLGGIGYTVSGAATGDQVETAAAFTPLQNATAKMGVVAVGLVLGTNQVRVKLHADAGGAPGAVLRSAQTSGLPSFGSCCVTVSFNATGSGVPLKAGTQYWLSVSTSKAGADTWAAWNFNNVQAVGTFAQKFDGGAWNVNFGDMPAFSIHGN